MRINPFTCDLTAREAKMSAEEVGQPLILAFTRAEREKDIREIKPGGPRYHEEWRQVATRIEILDSKGRVTHVLKDRDGPTGPVKVERTWGEAVWHHFTSGAFLAPLFRALLLLALFLPLYRGLQRVDADLAWWFWWAVIVWIAVPNNLRPR